MITKPEEIKEAILEGNLEKIKQLIKDKKLNIEQRFDPYKQTIWHLAAEGTEYKHYEVLELLLKTFAGDLLPGALDIKEDNCLTPIHYAAKEGVTRNIELLVMYGANPTIPNDLDCTPLALLKKRGHDHQEYALEQIILNRSKLQAKRREQELLERKQKLNTINTQSSIERVAHSIYSWFQSNFMKNHRQAKYQPLPTDESYANKKTL